MVVFDLNYIRYAPSKMNHFTFIDIDLLASNHYVITFRFLRIRESVLRPALITVVSSANIVKELSVQALSRSLMYSRKTKGPSTDPCGTPHKTLPRNCYPCKNLTEKCNPCKIFRANIFLATILQDLCKECIASKDLARNAFQARILIDFSK